MALINKKTTIDGDNKTSEFSGPIGKWYQLYLEVKSSVDKALNSEK